MATINNIEVQGDKNGNDYGLANLTDLASQELELTNKILANATAIADNLSEINLHKSNEDRHVTPALINSLVRKEVLGLYYTAAQVAEMINDISVGGGAHLKVVDELPQTGLEQIIYLVPNGQTGDNVKDEYIWIDDKWEVIGSTSIDLTDYYTKNEVNNKISELDSKYVRVNDTTLVKLNNENEINLQEDHYNAWFGYRDGKVTNWKFGDGTEGGLADIYAKDYYLGDEKLSDLLGDKANDVDVVHKSGSETIDGTKIFISSPRVKKISPDIALSISDCDVTETPAETKSASFYFRDKNNKNLSYVIAQQRISGEKRMCLRTHRTDNIDNYYSVDLDSEGNFYPEQQQMKLGTTSYKWADVNTVLLNGKTPAYADDLTDVLPTGSYIQFAGSQAPEGFLVCNGGEISRTTYAKLFAVIGTTYGSGDGSTTFNLPNLTDRFLQGSTSVGTVKDAGLPNITGGVDFHGAGSNTNVQNTFGSFIGRNLRSAYYGGTPSGGATSYDGFEFRSSSSSYIYGNSTTVQPPALTCLICIKY